MNIQELINNIKGIDKKIRRIIRIGVKISFAFCLIAVLLLATYTLRGELTAYYVGISIFKSGLFFIAGFVICGIAFNNIMKEFNR